MLEARLQSGAIENHTSLFVRVFFLPQTKLKTKSWLKVLAPTGDQTEPTFQRELGAVENHSYIRDVCFLPFASSSLAMCLNRRIRIEKRATALSTPF